MKFNNPYFSIKAKIELLSKWIIVHCTIYYYLNDSIVEDKMYDDNAKQLYQMIKENKDIFKETKYYYCLYDFNPATGYGIYERLNKDHQKAIILIAFNLTQSSGERNKNG